MIKLSVRVLDRKKSSKGWENCKNSNESYHKRKIGRRLTIKYFHYAFMYFKRGNQPISEKKALEWMDAQIKTKEVDISIDDHPKMDRIGDYWSEHQTTKITNILKEYKNKHKTIC